MNPQPPFHGALRFKAPSLSYPSIIGGRVRRFRYPRNFRSSLSPVHRKAVSNLTLLPPGYPNFLDPAGSATLCDNYAFRLYSFYGLSPSKTQPQSKHLHIHSSIHSSKCEYEQFVEPHELHVCVIFSPIPSEFHPH